MIIFLIVLLIIILILTKFKIDFFILVENTKSHIEIKSLFYQFRKNGRLTLKLKEKSEIQKEYGKNQRLKNKKKSKLFSKIKLWFLKTIQYDEIVIYEKIGVLDPVITSYALPVLSIITAIPLNFFHINYQNFNYLILPDYHHSIFVFNLKGKASFRMIDLIISIIKNFLHKLFTRS